MIQLKNIFLSTENDFLRRRCVENTSAINCVFRHCLHQTKIIFQLTKYDCMIPIKLISSWLWSETNMHYNLYMKAIRSIWWRTAFLVFPGLFSFRSKWTTVYCQNIYLLWIWYSFSKFSFFYPTYNHLVRLKFQI